MLTPYQIADLAETLDGVRNTQEINYQFRRQDESHLYPVSGRFNATERAIRRVRKHMSDCGMSCVGLEYALALDAEIERIVNSI